MKIAVLGAGRMGLLCARVLSEIPEVEEVVIGNRSIGHARKLADEFDENLKAQGAAGRVSAMLRSCLYAGSSGSVAVGGFSFGMAS